MRTLHVNFLLSLSLFLLGSCGQSNTDKNHTAVKSESSKAQKYHDESTKVAASQTKPIEEETKDKLPWIEDDYAKALQAARESNKPILLDMWAPWCHTCLSMKHYVFSDASLLPFKDRFIWLAVDTDKQSSAPLLEKFQMRAWPTFFIVDPKNEHTLGVHSGSASIRVFRAFLEDGEAAFQSKATLSKEDPRYWIAIAQNEENPKEKLNAFNKALSLIDIDSPRRPGLLTLYVASLRKQKRYEQCVDLGIKYGAQPDRSASAADFLWYAGDCATHLKDDNPKKDMLRRFALKRLSALVADNEAPLSIDDRSDAMRIAREFAVALKEPDRAKSLAQQQKRLLDEAFAKSPNPLSAMTFNWPRAEVYHYLNIAESLIPDLQKNAADLPDEYDPPYRLAWVLHKINKHEEALVAAKNALSKAYGPRKARVFMLIESIHDKRDDKPALKNTLESRIAFYQTLPKTQLNDEHLKQAQDRLKKIAK